MSTATTQKTPEAQPQLFEKMGLSYYIKQRPLNLDSPDLIYCPCARGYHILHYEFANKPLRVYGYAIIECPLIRPKRRYIVIAFFCEGEHHRAIMGYDEETYQLLKSFNEKFKQKFAVLLKPCWLETPKFFRQILMPAV